MGVVNHNCIVATTWNPVKWARVQAWINDLHERDQKLFTTAESWVNHHNTIVLVPDGSKEGWTESDEGDELRDRFIEQLKLDEYDDGSSPWAWVEVGFGEFGQKVLRGNNTNRYSDAEYAES